MSLLVHPDILSMPGNLATDSLNQASHGYVVQESIASMGPLERAVVVLCSPHAVLEG